MDEDTLKIFSRLKQNSDGMDFISFLERLSKENYEAFKGASQEMNDIHKGKALALDALLKAFSECDNKLTTLANKQPDWGV